MYLNTSWLYALLLNIIYRGNNVQNSVSGCGMSMINTCICIMHGSTKEEHNKGLQLTYEKLGDIALLCW